MVLSPLVILAQLCIVIWGSVLVFGKFFYSITRWKYNNLYQINAVRPSYIHNIFFTKIGSYASWTYGDETNDGYCGYTPFMYSFVMLIIGWAIIPFLMCCLCTFIVRGCWIGIVSFMVMERWKMISCHWNYNQRLIYLTKRKVNFIFCVAFATIEINFVALHDCKYILFLI